MLRSRGATPLGHGDRRTQTWRHRPDASVLGPLARVSRIHQELLRLDLLRLLLCLPFAPLEVDSVDVGVRNGTCAPSRGGEARPGGVERDGEPIDGDGDVVSLLEPSERAGLESERRCGYGSRTLSLDLSRSGLVRAERGLPVLRKVPRSGAAAK